MADDPLVALAERLRRACLDRGLTIATAESCTGGLIADRITEVPGSSACFLGGLVCYSNRAKVDGLGVPESLLERHGAVSAQVARAMAVGARERFGADLAVAVTGIAGPDGGTPDKPVGLTYVSLAGGAEPEVRRFVWPGDRTANKRASAAAALELLVAAAEAAAGRGERPGR